VNSTPADSPATPPSLDGRVLHVVDSEAASAVDARTKLRCKQRGPIVTATYRGGRVRAGYLIGKWHDDELRCDYVQVSTDDVVDKGHSVCRVTRLPDGRLRVKESFTWDSKDGAGVNVFEEM
jgi:hypothetical protein